MRAGLLSPIKILVYLPPLTVMLPSWKPVKEVHREIRRSYEEHLGAVKALLESSDTGGGLGRIGIGGIPQPSKATMGCSTIRSRVSLPRSLRTWTFQPLVHLSSGVANEEHSVYCGNCGSIVKTGDVFCGVCGTRIPPEAQEVVLTQEIPMQISPPPSIPSRRRNRKLTSGVMVGASLDLLLTG